jgi:hypothetical protein
MHNPQDLRSLSRECRERAKTALEPEVIVQLRLWAIELAVEADDVEWRSEDGEEPGL